MENKKVFYDGEEKEVLETPYTQEEMRTLKDDDNIVSGIVSVYPSDMIENDLEGFLDLISEKLVGSSCLMNVNYNVAGLGGDDEILLEVIGDVSEVLDEDDNEDEDEDEDIQD